MKHLDTILVIKLH